MAFRSEIVRIMSYQPRNQSSLAIHYTLMIQWISIDLITVVLTTCSWHYVLEKKSAAVIVIVIAVVVVVVVVIIVVVVVVVTKLGGSLLVVDFIKCR